MTENTSGPGFRSGFVHLFGRTNAGKSTLLNHLVRFHVSIVGRAAQTTRHRILAVRHEPRAQMIFVDLPGVHRPIHRMNERMAQVVARSFADEPDVVVFLVDASVPYGAGDAYAAEMLKAVSSPVVLALNKTDLIAKPLLLPLIDLYRKTHPFKAIVPLSALRGEGVEELIQKIRTLLPEGPRYFSEDYLTDRPESFFIEELIREAVLAHTREEIPHSAAVQIERREEKEDVFFIKAVIFIEKESQKGILVGRGGGMIKRISTAARKSLEDFLQKKVFLELRAAVKKDWRDLDSALDSLGIMGNR